MKTTTSQPGSPPPSLGWLTLGATVGLVVAAVGILDRSSAPTPLPTDAVASVNGTLLHEGTLRRALAASLPADEEPGNQRRADTLSQLIDEELLVQRGIELGMPVAEPTVRAAIIQSLVASVTAEADAADPDDDELQEFLENHADRYTFSTALAVDAWITDDEWRAQDAVARVRREQSADELDGVRRVPGLPLSALPVERLRMFVGPAIAAAATEMPAGSSAVYARQGRWYIVRVTAHEESALAELDAVRAQVLLDYRRTLADTRLREYLARLRSNADLRVVDR